MRRFSLAHLTVIEVPPPQMIHLAAEAGYDAVGLRLVQVTPTTPGYPLHHDAALLRQTRAALAATGLAVQDIEFLRLTPDFVAADHRACLAAGAELGARHVICAPYDPDLSRMADNLAALADEAAALGLAAVLEFFPWTVLPGLTQARDLIAATGRADVGLLVDALHFDRSASRLADLAALPPGALPFLHLCDAPVHPPYTEAQLLHAGRVERLPPGEGQIDLRALLAAVPADLPLALEVPMEAHTARHGPAATARRVLAAAKALVG